MPDEQGGSSSEYSDERQGVVTPNALVIPLTDEDRRQARECLDRSGRITIKFKEISATRLTDIVDISDMVIWD
jgi:hypothetical protein